MTTITFGSVCSGLEAASVAWHRFGWRAAWLAEVEPNPVKLLHHHYGSGRPHYMLDPDAEGLNEDERKQRRAMIKAVAKLPLVPAHSTAAPPNLGDMKKIPALLRNGDIFPPDVFTGGTPCQAFSLAGLRESLNDARGNLSLTFCEIANEIDIQRAANGLLPCVIKWENVPGVLSTQDNAFGHFLAGLAGEDEPLVPSGKKWTNAGCVFGPQRVVAWRVLDAQFFGLAQRRRRVFVVASAREGFDPAAVLFEPESLRRHSPPSRGQGEDTAAGTLRSTDGGSDVDHARAGHLVAGTLTASYGEQTGQDLMDMEGGLQLARTVALRGREGGGTAELGDDLANCLRASTGGGDKPHVLGPTSYAIQAGALRTNPASGPDGVGVQEGIAYTLEARAEVQAVCVTGDITHTLKAEGFDASEDGTGRGQPIVACVHADAVGRTGVAVTPSADAEGRVRLRDPGLGIISDGTSYNLMASGQAHAVATGMAVRRLTPRECERLQGFPDDYTLIPIRQISAKRAAKLRADGDPVLQVGDEYWELTADGPRYKALGNSWAVPNVVWIGNRINQVLRAQMLETAA